LPISAVFRCSVTPRCGIVDKGNITRCGKAVKSFLPQSGIFLVTFYIQALYGK
jgi:hypothetical protein